MNIRKPVKKVLYKIQQNPVSKFLFEKEIQKRSKLPVTDIENLSKHINMFAPFTSELQPVNDWYGHAVTLKKFLGLPEAYQFKFIIEHGMYFSEQVADIELESDLPSFMTYSPYRAKILKKIKKKAFAIGPFIHYANHYLSEEQLEEEKKRLGKTILFFPFHSLLDINHQYNMDLSYKKIKSLAKDYKTVRVCMYWKDVLLGKQEYYQSKGWECVTAGHILDPLFLSRLKSIIHISDITISNDASTPLSYSVYMNKPHIIFLQRPKNGENKYFNRIMQQYWSSQPYKQIVKEFSKIQFFVSTRQRKLMNYYCGTNEVKSKKQLLKIVKEGEDLFQKYREDNS